jgi:type IV pilus assembly protein PilW
VLNAIARKSSGVRSRSAGNRAQAGFNLVELMISLTIGLILVAAVLAILLTNSTSRRTNERTSDLQLNGRIALDFIRRDLQLAGFRGLTWTATGEEITVGAVGTITGDCVTGGGFVTNIAQAVWGSNNSNPFAASCIPASSYSAGDVLVMRRAALAVDPASAGEAGAIHFRSAYARAAVYKGGTVPGGSWGMAGQDFQDYRVEASVYYVGTCTSSPVTTGLCRLTLLSGSANPSMQSELAASGVENIHFQYGRVVWGAAGGNTAFLSANAISGSATDTARTAWNDITAVRVWLLVRAATPEPGYVNTTTYDLGDASVTVNDGFRRQVFSTVVNLRNS